ncbi:tyrosine-type recombinase/integrase [Methylobacterium sp. R2-1]|uniref:tyrosine-type recombinase/integrase n=1 Tax=Methylobacterium sp. R2-1 TaxID=2587064 RepID=UPI001610136A|nr:site-specific integrase [Methylobacterium sp. R2-1]
MPLADTRLRALRPNGTRYELPDRDGLTLRVSQRGVMTWAVTFRVQGGGTVGGTPRDRLSGDKRRITLGEYPLISLAEAREKALAVRRLARAGTDPVETLRPKPKAVVRVHELIERYTTEHLRRNTRAGGDVEKLLALHISPRWGDRELASITRTDFIALLEEVRQPTETTVKSKRGSYKTIRGGPGAAAEVRKWTRAMFQFGFDVELLPDNPLANVRNRDRLKPRDRVLSMEELRTVWKAASAMPYPWGPYFQLIMLTGDRRGEWANARIDWLTPNRSRLEIPASEYKTGKPQVVPLSRQARAIVQALPAPEFGPYVLSSLAGSRPISDFSGAKAKLDALIAGEREAALSPWVVHDLRRSMATHMERLGIAPHIIEVCLGHTLKGIGATYRHYSYLAEKTAALQVWADELAPELVQDIIESNVGEVNLLVDQGAA